jgi:hypothetical protein
MMYSYLHCDSYTDSQPADQPQPDPFLFAMRRNIFQTNKRDGD